MGQIAFFTAQHLEPRASNTAGRVWRNQHPLLAFDPSTQEYARFSGVIPPNYQGNGVTVDVYWCAEDTSVGPHDVRLEGAFENLKADSHDIDSDGFATGVGVTDTEASASGIFSRARIAFSNSQIDGLQAGEPFRFELTRDTGHADDDGTLIGDCQIRFVTMKES